MISIDVYKDRQGAWKMRILNVADGREILRSGAVTPREAAIWLLRKVNKVAVEVEERLVELGFLTEAECEAVIAEEDAVEEKSP